MVEMVNESGFRSNFDMILIRLPNGLVYPNVAVEQQTHSGDESAQKCPTS